MQYVVILTQRNVVHNDPQDKPHVHLSTQYIRCVNRNQAEFIVSRFGHSLLGDMIAEVGVYVWNGKGNTVLSLSNLEHVITEMKYDEEDRPARAPE